MCIAAFGFGPNSDFRFAFAANRDELHARPTARADWWDELPDVLGGRDLTAGGGRLAIDREGRLAAVTNLPQVEPRPFPRSRGELVSEFLINGSSAAEFSAEFAAASDQFGPCNLLVWDGAELHYSGTGVASEELEPGIHALGNAPLRAEWPRARRAELGFRDALATADPESSLLELLADRSAAEVENPEAAHGRRRTEIFVSDPHYGTRSSTVVLISHDGNVVFTERSYGPDGQLTGTERQTFSTTSA